MRLRFTLLQNKRKIILYILVVIVLEYRWDDGTFEMNGNKHFQNLFFY